MVLTDKGTGCQAMIKSDDNQKTITIIITGEPLRKRAYFSVIRHQLWDIHRSFENLAVEEKIPLPGHPDRHVSYKELLGYEKAKKDEYFSGELGKSFSVSKILDGFFTREEREQERIVIKQETHLNNVGNVTNSGNSTVKTGQVNRQETAQTQTVQQTQTVTQTVRQAVVDTNGRFKNLKDDLLEEVDIEIDDEKEKKRIQNDLAKTEKAFEQLEQTANQLEHADENNPQHLPAATTSRIEEFVNGLSNPASRFNKALTFVGDGTQKLQKLGRSYNKIAPYFALPSIPDILVGKDQ
jgi:internalin A